MTTLIAALYLLWVAWNQQFELALMQLLMTAMLLCYVDAGIAVLWQAWRMLRWLLLPIVLLHALFTPGEVLVSGWPFSKEGVSQGGWLALHLAALYLSAMLFSRLLSLHVLLWLAEFNRHIKRLMPMYIRLTPLMLAAIQSTLREHKQQWQAEGRRIRLLPVVLRQLVMSMEKNARITAMQVADNWSHQPHVDAFRIAPRRALLVAYWLAGMMLLAFMYLLWL